MEQPSPFLEHSWWFRLAAIAIAVAITAVLFQAGAITVYQDGILSARTLLFFFCWFGLERIVTGLAGPLLELWRQRR